MNYDSYPSETSKYRKLTEPLCYRPDGKPGCGIDLASQGDPVVPWAWQLDLPPKEFAYYNDNHSLRAPVNLHGSAFQKFVEDESLDFLYSSHLLEDVPREEWLDVLKLWSRAIKPGGLMIILCPERTLWAAALAGGQTPNCSHRYEPLVGDIGIIAKEAGMITISEKLTNLWDGDYSILYVGQKPKPELAQTPKKT